MKKIMAITGWTKEDWKEFGRDMSIWSAIFLEAILITGLL